MNTNKPIPHVHCDLIKAWADGAKIQTKIRDMWLDVDIPYGLPDQEYRIKPEPKPDYVTMAVFQFREEWKRPCYVCSWEGDIIPHGYSHHINQEDKNLLKFTFDGDTGKLKNVEIIK